MNIPKKITPSPIVDATFEMRFQSNLPAQVLPGLLFNSLKETYSNIEELPIMQLPSMVRDNEPSLRNRAYYKLSSANFDIQIGPGILAIMNTVEPGKQYVGWQVFHPEITKVLKAVLELHLISRVDRLAFRYMNAFEVNEVSKRVRLKLNIPDIPSDGPKMIGFVTESGPYKARIQIVDEVDLANKYGNRKASLLDMDIFIEEEGLPEDDISLHVDAIHSLANDLFYKVVKPEYINELSPEYD